LFSEGINQYLKNTHFIERKQNSKLPLRRDSFYNIDTESKMPIKKGFQIIK
jgi:hypothetical protein